MDIIHYFKITVKNSRLWTDSEFPFKAHLTKGHPRVAVVVGENGSGKSLLVQIVSAYCRTHLKLQNISVSIRERTGSGLSDIASMRRTMMFGDESTQSTGAVSTRVLEAAFRTLLSRAKEGSKAVLILDEPELGLSDGYAAAMGAYLAEKSSDLPPLAVGVVIVTHSRSLVKSLMDTLGGAPSFVNMGSEESLLQWLKGDSPKSVQDLLALPRRCHDNNAKVTSITQAKRHK